jgi:hypothetical protein
MRNEIISLGSGYGVAAMILAVLVLPALRDLPDDWGEVFAGPLGRLASGHVAVTNA